MSSPDPSALAPGIPGQFSFRRFRVLLRSQRYLLIAGTLLIGSLNAIQALTEVPLYISTSKLQLQPFDVSRSVDNRASIQSDVLNETVRLTNAVLVFQSEAFLSELAKELNENHHKEQLVLSWGIGRKLKLSYALFRLGLTDVQYQRVDTSALTTEELGILLNGMIQVTPLAADDTIEVKISALEEKTAFFINRAVLTAFMRANQRLDQEEFNRSISFLNSQAESVKEKLDAAEQKLAEYLKAHINVGTDGASGTFMSSFLSLRLKRQELEKSIEADRTLVANLNQKLKLLDANEGSPTEVFETLKVEVAQLSYQRAKLLEQGYATDHPGVLALERRIESSRDFIRKSQSVSGPDARDVFGQVEYRKALAGKIIQTQEALDKQTLAVRGLIEQIRSMEREVNELPSDGITVSALKREVSHSAELYGELVRRLELMEVRSQANKNALREVTAPNALNAPNSLPFFPRFLFGLFAGFIFGLSGILVADAARPRMVVRADAEGAGFRYAGKYRGTPDSCAEVLAALECVFSGRRQNGDKTPVVLCSAASPSLTLQTFMPLVDYMASRNENVLLMAEDASMLPAGYASYEVLGGVKIYRYPGGKKDILQITGAESFGVIKLVLEEYAAHYAAVFLFVAEGSESSVYSLCRRIADRILILGEEGSHTTEEYRGLSAGFGDPGRVYTALLPYGGRHFRYVRSRLRKRGDRSAPDAVA